MNSTSAKCSWFVAIVLGSALCPLAASQQAAWKPFTERRPYLDPRATLNKDAEATDPAGIHVYAEDLAHYILPSQAGEKYANSFADRLAKAEQETREGKRKLVPDTAVLDAFYKLTARPDPATMASDLADLRRFRTYPWLARQYPALLTSDRNGTNCNPGEAVFLLATMLQGDEWRMKAAPSVPPAATAPLSAVSHPYFRNVPLISGGVGLYMMQNPHKIQKLFNRAAKILDI